MYLHEIGRIILNVIVSELFM